jgi:sugar transferase (PEP-CTERM system associated)
MSNKTRHFLDVRAFFYISLEALLMIGILIFSIYLCRPNRILSIIYDEHFALKVTTFVTCILIPLYLLSLYEERVVPGNVLELSGWRLFQALVIAAFLLSFIYYIYPFLAFERDVFLTSFLIIGVTSLAIRLIYQKILTIKHIDKNVLIIGCGALAAEIAQEIEKQKDIGYNVVGFVTNEPERIGKKLINKHILGDPSQIMEIVNEKKVDQIIVALDERRGGFPLMQLLECKVQGLIIKPGVEFYERLTGRLKIKHLVPSTMIFSKGFKKSTLQLALKRFTELIMSFCGLIILAPLMLIIALLIKLESRGPVFYRQERVGEYGKTFELVKFRSMYVDAETGGPVWAKENDNRVTRVGKWLRKLRLDEIPQMINVIRGNMSFVGPRPERPHFVNILRREIPFYDQRLSVKPGITGWAQIMYIYAGSKEETMEKMTYDLFYIKNMSLFLDYYIIYKTIMVVFFGKGAR